MNENKVNCGGFARTKFLFGKTSLFSLGKTGFEIYAARMELSSIIFFWHF